MQAIKPRGYGSRRRYVAVNAARRVFRPGDNTIELRAHPVGARPAVIANIANYELSQV